MLCISLIDIYRRNDQLLFVFAHFNNLNVTNTSFHPKAFFLFLKGEKLAVKTFKDSLNLTKYSVFNY